MKLSTWTAIIGVPIVLGLAVGVGLGWWSVARRPWPGYPLLAQAQPAGSGGASAGQLTPLSAQPRAEVPSDTHDFGRIESNSVVRHEFEIRNVGSAPLRLTKGGSTCRCTVLDFEDTEVPPGGSQKIKIEFNGHEYLGAVTQNATIYTSDPQKPQIVFTIKADVVKSIRVVPSEIVFSRLIKMQPAVGEAKIYVFRSQPVKITGVEVTPQNESAKFIDVELEPLTEEELKVEPGAKAGYRLLVRIKPGLPLGPIQQKIRVNTDQKDMPQLEVPLQGRVESDVNIVGTGWDTTRGILHLGRVSQATGAERRVMLRLGALESRPIQVSVEKTSPDFLQVTIGEPRLIESSFSIFVPVTVRVPPGVGPANYFGNEENQLGKVILKTNHPDAPEIKILVRFAVD